MTSTTPISDRSALLRAALASLPDVTAALVLMDCLEEQRAISPLDALKWRMAFDPSDEPRLEFARLIEASDPEWAEWIRVWCRLREWWRGKKLEARDTALRAAVEPRLRRGAKCERCHEGRIPSGVYEMPTERCKTCHGTGWSGALHRTRNLVDEYGAVRGDELIHVDWRCGFPHTVHLPMLTYAFTGEQVSEWGLRLFAEWPMIERVVVGDRVPRDSVGSYVEQERSFDWTDPSIYHYTQQLPSDLPKVLFSEVREASANAHSLHDDFAEFPTAAAATEALGPAVARAMQREAMRALVAGGGDNAPTSRT